MIIVAAWDKREHLPQLLPTSSMFIANGHEPENWDRICTIFRQRKHRHRFKFSISKGEVDGVRGAIVDCVGMIPTLRDMEPKQQRRVTDFLCDWDSLPARSERTFTHDKPMAIVRSANRWNRMHNGQDFIVTQVIGPREVVAYRLGKSLAEYNEEARKKILASHDQTVER